MNNLKFGLGFIFVLAILLAASSLFFRHRSEPTGLAPLDVVAEQQMESKTVNKDRAKEAEAVSSERGVSEQSLDGEANSSSGEEVADEPESNLESVFMNLTQEMARRGYAKGLSDCIESQFRENQGVENPKNLDEMLRICDSQFKIAPAQSQQIRDVVLQAIAKAQSKDDDDEKTSVQ